MNDHGHKSKSFHLIAFILLISLFNPAEACTTFIVGKKSTVEGKTIIARTSDTIDARRAKNLKIYYNKNAVKSYIGLPYWDLEADEKKDMAQVATNLHGVSISATETIAINKEILTLDPPSRAEDGVSERNIPHLVMPFATTAQHAVDILGKAIEEKGLKFNVGFGVLFADKKEAWYLETLSGHQWVAIKIPEDVYFVAANGPGQIQAYSPLLYEYKLSTFNGHTPIEFAVQNGIAKTTETNEFNFRKTFADIQNPQNPNKNFVRLAYLQNHFNPSTQYFDLDVINKGEFPMFLQPDKKISVEDIQKMFASHYEEFKDFDPYQRYNKDENKSTYYYPIANLNTSNAHITLIDSPLVNGDKNIANLEYIALGMPTISFYLPIYYGIQDVPKSLTGATNQADQENEKLFWQFRKLQALVFLSAPKEGILFNPQERKKIVRRSYELLAKEIEQDRLAMEADYKKNGDLALIDSFTTNTLNKLSILNHQLLQRLMLELNINTKFGLKNEEERAHWFTAKIREQDCNYKPEHCPTITTTQDR